MKHVLMGSTLDGAPLLWCLVAAALFGAAAPLTKPLLGQADPFALAGLLYLGGALGVAPLALRSRRSARSRRRASRRSLLHLAGATLSGGVIAPVLLLFALRASAAANVSLWLTFEPVATALLALALFRESIQPRIWVALALVVGASILLAGAQGAALVPALLAAGACVLWGLDNNLVARIDDLSPSDITLVKSLAAGSTNLALAWLVIGALPGPGVALSAMLIGVFCYGLSIWLFVAGAQQMGAVRAQLAFATAPFLGAVMSWTLLSASESPTPAVLAAGGLMALGAYLATTARHEHEHEHAATVHSHVHRHDDGHHGHPHAAGDEPSHASAWHFHEHAHESVRHEHPHVTDIHHAHAHD